MKNNEINKYITKIRNNLENIYNAFYLWKSLRNAEYNIIYNKYKYFWGIVIVSVQQKWLLGIPKLFEESRKGSREVISIPFLLKFIPEGKDKEEIKKEIDKQKSILKNIKIWRNKILAHQDKIVVDDIKAFYKEYPVKGKQVELLLSSIEKIIGRINAATNKMPIIYCYSRFREESKQDLDEIVSTLMKDEERGKQRGKGSIIKKSIL